MKYIITTYFSPKYYPDLPDNLQRVGLLSYLEISRRRPCAGDVLPCWNRLPVLTVSWLWCSKNLAKRYTCTAYKTNFDWFMTWLLCNFRGKLRQLYGKWVLKSPGINIRIIVHIIFKMEVSGAALSVPTLFIGPKSCFVWWCWYDLILSFFNSLSSGMQMWFWFHMQFYKTIKWATFMGILPSETPLLTEIRAWICSMD